MWRIVLALAILAVCVPVRGDIECKDAYAPHEPIAVVVKPTGLPDGAKIRGSFIVSDAAFIEVAGTYYVWAAPGKHSITAAGIWVLTKDVQIEGQTVPILLDFGQYSYTKAITVGEVVPPVPPPVPPPPGPRRAVILEESSERTNQQAALFTALRKDLGDKLEILDDDQQAAAKYLTMAKDLPRPTLIVLSADQLVRAVSCPSSVDGVKQEVAK